MDFPLSYGIFLFLFLLSYRSRGYQYLWHMSLESNEVLPLILLPEHIHYLTGLNPEYQCA